MNQNYRRRWLLLGIFSLGLVLKLAIIFKHKDNGMATYITDDAYFNYEVAKNIHQGNGFVFHEGIKTNATHPLYVILLVPILSLYSISSTLPPVVSLIMLAVVSIITVVFIYKSAAEIYTETIAVILVLFWLFNPSIIQDYLRGMGGSPLQIMFLSMVTYYYIVLDTENLDKKSISIFGTLWGLMFLSRPDSAYFAVAFALVIAYKNTSLDTALIEKAKELFSVGSIGTVALGIASPWLLFNWVNFGTLTPVSADAYQYIMPSRSIRLSEIALQLVTESVTTIVSYNFTHRNPVSKFAGLTILATVGLLVLSGLYLNREEIFSKITQLDFLVLGAVPYYLISHYYLLSGRQYYMIEEYLLIILILPLVIYSLNYLLKRPYSGEAIMVSVLLLGIVLSGGMIYNGGTVDLYDTGKDAASYLDKNVSADEKIATRGMGVIQYYTRDHDVLITDPNLNPETLAAIERNKELCYIESQNVTYYVGSVLEDTYTNDAYISKWDEQHSTSTAQKITKISQDAGLLFSYTKEQNVQINRLQHEHSGQLGCQ